MPRSGEGGGNLCSGSCSKTRVGKDVLCLWYIKNPNTRTTANANIGNTEYSNMCTVVSFVAAGGLTVDGKVLGAVAREKMEQPQL